MLPHVPGIIDWDLILLVQYARDEFCFKRMSRYLIKGCLSVGKRRLKKFQF